MTLKEARQLKGISQTKMAIELGMSTQNYIKYERGEYVAMSDKIRNRIRYILEWDDYEYNRN